MSNRKNSVSGRQRKYVKGVLSGKTKKQAAIDAGYAESTAENATRVIESKNAVQDLFAKLLAQAGATDEAAAKAIADGLHATAVLRETQFADREEIPDHPTRLEAAGMVIKVRGFIVDKKQLEVGDSLAALLGESIV